MENSISKYWYLQLLKGIILILLALLIFMSPGGALLASAIYIALGLVIAGFVIVILGFSAKGIIEGWGWRVFEGLMDIFLGVILLSNPAATAEALPFVIGFWGSFYGFMLIVDGFAENGNRGVKIISGILLVLFSSIMMFNPLAAGFSLEIWIAIVFLISGVYNFFASFSLRKI